MGKWIIVPIVLFLVQVCFTANTYFSFICTNSRRTNTETTIEGRVIFDMLPYMQRNHKLSSYSLNSVCAEFLSQQK